MVLFPPVLKAVRKSFLRFEITLKTININLQLINSVFNIHDQSLPASFNFSLVF